MSENAPENLPAVGTTISTAAEYTALPYGSVIRNHQGITAVRVLDRGIPAWNWWEHRTGDKWEHDHEAAKQLGEAVVLHIEHPASAKTFTDKLGRTGHEGDRIVVPAIDEGGLPQLEFATVVEIIVREPSPFASTLSVRTRVGDDESAVYEPDEVLIVDPR